jgi:phage baseplate assembly protein W
MAFGAINRFPNDTRPRVGIGVDIPFNAGEVFTSNYTTAESIKNNLINYFLTNPGERCGNPSFGGGLREFIFEQISNNTLEYLKEDIGDKMSQNFPNVDLQELSLVEDPDSNEISVQMYYSVTNTGINDELTLTFN